MIALRDHRRRGLTLAVLIGCGLFAAYLIARTDNYGGEAWGARWFVPLTPLLWWYIRDAHGVLRNRSRLWRMALAALILLSFLTALAGVQDAWRVVPPIVRL